MKSKDKAKKKMFTMTSIGLLAVASVFIACNTADLISNKPKSSRDRSFYEKHIKRPQDLILASSALIVLSPIMGIIALLARHMLGTPVFFVQERPGMQEKVFKMIKFRSMTEECGPDGEMLPDEMRLTAFGRFLRATSLDELPELINIIKGDMAIVGPRPLATIYLPYYTNEEKRRHSVRPGLTGLAQVRGRNNIEWEEKLKLDVEYVNNISFLNDLKIIKDTIKKVLTREGIGQGKERPISLHEERQDWIISSCGAIRPNDNDAV